MAEACQPNHSSESSDRAREALDEITTLMEQETESKLHEVYRKLQKKLTAEIRFLKQAKKKNKISSNIPYLLGVFETVKQSDNVDQVICDQRKYGIIIDVVCEERTTWKKVVARNPQAMHLIWASDGQYGGKDIVRRMQRYVNAAKKESEFSPPKVICVFTKGVTGQMADHLESLGVQVQGTRVAVSDDTQQRLQVIEEFSDSEPELESSDYETDTDSEDESEAPKDTLTGISATVARMCTEEKVFLDVTSMVIFVSDVCNGGEDFEFEDLEMKTQAEQERKTPVYKFLKPYFDNCLLVTCDTALKNFMDFTKLLGGEKENERAKLLANRLTVVPDNMSDRFQRVIKRGRVGNRLVKHYESIE